MTCLGVIEDAKWHYRDNAGLNDCVIQAVNAAVGYALFKFRCQVRDLLAYQLHISQEAAAQYITTKGVCLSIFKRFVFDSIDNFYSLHEIGVIPPA